MATNRALSDTLSVGASFKRTTIELQDYSGSGINSDIGLAYINPKYNLYIVAHNIIRFKKLNYKGRQSEKFPFKLITTVSKTNSFKQLVYHVHLQGQYYENNPFLYSVGLQLHRKKMPYLEALLGYRTRPHLNTTISRKAIGLNLKLKGLKLSYAFEKSSVPIFDNMHYFSFSLFRPSKPSKKSNTPPKKTIQHTQPIQPTPSMTINLKNTVTIQKNQTKKGIGGKVTHVKQLFINDTKVFIRPDNKFYNVIALPKKDTFEVKFKAIGHNGKKVIQTITFSRNILPKKTIQHTQPTPSMTINLKNTVTIQKNQTKKGMSGKVTHVKQLFINDTKVFIRPDNKFYIVMPLPQKETFKFKFKAIGHNGKEVIQTITFSRKSH
jgi:RNase P/RNase MRP subunit p29